MLRCLAAALSACILALPVLAAEVTIGFQRVYNPWKVAIADRRIEEVTGYRVSWKKFDSGAKVMEALAAGDVQVAMAGSSPISAAASEGIDIRLFWIVGVIGEAEALVVRDGAGIRAPQDLRGKRIAVPFGSTAHFHLLFALEQFAIAAEETQLVDMQPPSIQAAWERGEIDAAFVWEPALSGIRETGRTLITSGRLSDWGKATFDGMVAAGSFAAANPGFLCRFVEVLAEADRAFRENPDAYDPGTDAAIKIASLVGGDDADVRAVLDKYSFPELRAQASEQWLGGGSGGGGAKALLFTSEFLFAQGRVPAVLAAPQDVVTDRFVRDALDGCS